MMRELFTLRDITYWKTYRIAQKIVDFITTRVLFDFSLWERTLSKD